MYFLYGIIKMLKGRKEGKDMKIKKEELTAIRDNIAKDYQDTSVADFVEERKDLNNGGYFGDAFHEFADSNTSIYYADQKNYYLVHQEECDNALLELYDAESITELIKDEGVTSLMCKAGALGEYQAIYYELAGAEKEIKQLLALNYLIDNFDEFSDNLTAEKVTDILEYCGENNIVAFDDLLGLLRW